MQFQIDFVLVGPNRKIKHTLQHEHDLLHKSMCCNQYYITDVETSAFHKMCFYNADNGLVVNELFTEPIEKEKANWILTWCGLDLMQHFRHLHPMLHSCRPLRSSSHGWSYLWVSCTLFRLFSNINATGQIAQGHRTVRDVIKRFPGHSAEKNWLTEVCRGGVNWKTLKELQDDLGQSEANWTRV